MATSKKPPIPRFVQKAFIFSSVLFVAAQLILPILQGIQAIPMGAQVFNVPWFYYNTAVILFPVILALFAYFRLSPAHGKLWRLTIAILIALVSLAVYTIINNVAFIISMAAGDQVSKFFFSKGEYILFGLSVIAAIATIYAVTRKSLKSFYTHQLPLRLLVTCYILFIAHYLLSVAGTYVLGKGDTASLYYVLGVTGSLGILLTLGYKFTNAKLSRPVRLLYALLVLLTFGNIYLTINSALTMLPSIFGTDLAFITNMYTTIILTLAFGYVLALSILRRRKLL